MRKTEIMQRLMIFIDETDRYQGVNLSSAVLEKLRTEGISGATVLRGTAGFGIHGTVHTAALLDLSISLPEIITAIDTEEKMQAVLPKLEEMIREGLIVVDEVETIKISKGNKVLDDKDGDKKNQSSTVSGQMRNRKPNCIKSANTWTRLQLQSRPSKLWDEVIALMIKNGRALACSQRSGPFTWGCHI